MVCVGRFAANVGSSGRRGRRTLKTLNDQLGSYLNRGYCIARTTPRKGGGGKISATFRRVDRCIGAFMLPQNRSFPFLKNAIRFVETDQVVGLIDITKKVG